MRTIRHDMILEPLQTPDPAADEYHALDAKSLFRLHSTRPRLPAGWVLVRDGGDRTVWNESTLIADADGEEPERYALPPHLDQPLLLRLPRPVRSLTLSWPARRDELPGRLELVELGPLRATRELLRDYLKTVTREPAMLGHFVLRAGAIVRRHGVRGLRTALVARFPGAAARRYRDWVSRYDTLRPDDVSAILAHVEALKVRTRFTIILAVAAGAPSQIEAALRAVRNQLYNEWELVVARTEALPLPCRDVIDAWTRQEPRIRSVVAPTPAAAVNRALLCASGGFCLIVDAHGELAPQALYVMAAAIGDRPDTAMMYADADSLDPDGRRHAPLFKPDWNPDLLVSRPFMGPAVAYRTDLLRQLGGWREAHAGVEDWDLALRASAAVPEGSIRHLPHVLYHRHAVPGAPRHPPPSSAARQMLAEHFAQRGVAVQLTEGQAGAWRVVYPCAPAPFASVIIPTHNGTPFLQRCIESVLHGTDYPALEVIVVDNDSDEPATLEYLAGLSAEPRVHLLRFDAPFNFSAIINFAAARARGDMLVLLNNDVEAITADWLSEMVGHARRPEVGAVGALLLYPDGRIQHAGLVLGLGGLAGHAYRGAPGPSGYGMERTVPQDVSAVTAACMVLRKDVFRGVGGFDESLAVAFNDVDFCLRLRAQGHRIVWTPYARLTHIESASRGLDRTAAKARRFRREEALLRKRWGARLDDDPAYNPNLALLGSGFALAFPPRVVQPWRR